MRQVEKEKKIEKSVQLTSEHYKQQGICQLLGVVLAHGYADLQRGALAKVNAATSAGDTDFTSPFWYVYVCDQNLNGFPRASFKPIMTIDPKMVV